jgi:hypothetical protein
MEHPIQVEAQFTRCIPGITNDRWSNNYEFTIVKPQKYKDKKFLLSLFWSEVSANELVRENTYLVTVPRDEIGTENPICGSGYKFKARSKD